MTTPASAREAVVAACRHLAARGLSPGGSGNVSVRVGDDLLVTPTGSSLSRVRPEDLALVPVADAPGGGTVTGGGPRPSKELPLHRAVYAARPDARAVVHLHSPAAVAASCLDPAALPPEAATGPLPATTPYQVMRLGDLPVAPFALPGSTELAAGVADRAGTAPVLLLANHGSVVAGTHLDAAVDLAEELEAAAQVVLLLHGVPHRRLTPAQVAALRSR
ncbi:class II aldolase/adducin family protein [Cellulomonas sp. C5510]|uniref:class II aldolase/adducin family protein n=1 Tax=Cellulomonas sp. C5510 TaxID=2871170 RepID=UPI001C95060C|nr:class II aldolase/adducin family protein [Cellulomonas sp. C5510]QZN85500.1 class II aldolase/adducin family protein [Cellulomonas sp. C5510]